MLFWFYAFTLLAETSLEEIWLLSGDITIVISVWACRLQLYDRKAAPQTVHVEFQRHWSQSYIMGCVESSVLDLDLY